jgi:hypothetical protein
MIQMKHLEKKLELIAQALSTKNSQERTTVMDAHTSVVPPVNNTPHQVAQEASVALQTQHNPDEIPSAGLGVSRHGIRKSTNTTEIAHSTSCGHEDEMLLNRFRRLMAPNMPFVVLKSGCSAPDLTKSDPILMHAIRVVAYFHDTSKQQIMAKGLMRDICERQLINGEKSLGLVQAILVFSNWYNPHLYSPQNSTSLLHLAIALTTDLNIDRGPGNCEKSQMEAAMRAYGVARAAKTLTNDERRAVLGVFYLCSQTFTCFRKVDILHWTPWLSDCVQTLSDVEEHESDKYLVQLVHMQRIMQEASVVGHASAPCQIYASSFLHDLEIMGTISGCRTSSAVLQLQNTCTRIAIWQRSFARITEEATPSTLRQRLDGMWHCMEAVQAFLDIYMGMPTEDYLVVPAGVFSQFAYTFVVIIRALSFEKNGWDASALRETVDLSEIAENAAQRYEAVSHATLDGIPLKNEAFSKWGVRLRVAKAFHDAKIRSAMTDVLSDPGHVEGNNNMHQPPGPGSTSMEHAPIPMTFVTDPYLQSFVDFEDFWTGFSDTFQAPASPESNFGCI